jgi:HAD domain in Swiss Army Knife RNA repair proteins
LKSQLIQRRVRVDAAIPNRVLRSIGLHACHLNVKASGSSTYCVPKHLQTDTLVTNETNKPILFVDVDGVISLFGFAPGTGQLPGPLHWVDGVAHCIPEDVGQRLVTLAESFELVWATGWEERANEHLPYLLKLPFKELPCLTFDGRAVFGSAHWKIEAVDEYAAERPAAWIDDNLGEECRAWAAGRSAPTLLVETSPSAGLTDEHVTTLLGWARDLSP